MVKNATQGKTNSENGNPAGWGIIVDE